MQQTIKVDFKLSFWNRIKVMLGWNVQIMVKVIDKNITITVGQTV